MGFERLAMALQGKTSNYDTDVFTPLLSEIENITGQKYAATDSKKDVAFRVLSDHVRAIAFTIADGQLPSNNGAGYVIRRILRRAVRYAYSYLDYPKPVLHRLIPVLTQQMGDFFPELAKQQSFIAKVILEEEQSFLKTLESGLKRFKMVEEQLAKTGDKTIPGQAAFELKDTYGFPIDLTRLMASEKGLTIDEKAYDAALEEQKQRARAATKLETGDWVILEDGVDGEFIGYDFLESESKVTKYRQIKQKDKVLYQIVLDKTPFYAESGGQVGDTGYLAFGEEKISVTDTKKENDLIVHFVKKLPENIELSCQAVVNGKRRFLITNNHTATHLLHAALRDVLGEHVHQKGSLVHPDYLRFDFSHFQKVEAGELKRIESQINEKIRENIPLTELPNIPIEDAKAMGAMALFGEKYGDFVRVIMFDKDYSVELCGGTHVKATGEIGFCKITTETSLAAGVRRIFCVTGPTAYELISNSMDSLGTIQQIYKKPKDIIGTIEATLAENAALKKEIESMLMEKAGMLKNELKQQAQNINGVQFIGKQVQVSHADMVKKMAYDLKNEVSNLFLVLGSEINGKAHLTLMFDEQLTQEKNLNAGKLIRELAKNIKGGGGGQAYYATAGGKDASGLDKAIQAAKEIAESL